MDGSSHYVSTKIAMHTHALGPHGIHDPPPSFVILNSLCRRFSDDSRHPGSEGWCKSGRVRIRIETTSMLCREKESLSIITLEEVRANFSFCKDETVNGLGQLPQPFAGWLTHCD